MSIIDITGKPVRATVDTEHLADQELAAAPQPKEHEPRWFRRRRAEADKMFAALYHDFLADINSGQTPGTVTDREAIKREYGHRWAKYAYAELKGAEPIPLDPNAMYTEIQKTLDQHDAEEKHKRIFEPPVHQLGPIAMEEGGFAQLGQAFDGEHYLCNRARLVVLGNGEVKLTLRDQDCPPEAWYSRAVRPEYPYHFLLPATFTLGHFVLLMRGLMCPPHRVPPPDVLDTCRREFAELCLRHTRNR